jgi:hypothetical protein
LDEDFFVDTEDHISLLNILCDEVGDYKWVPHSSAPAPIVSKLLPLLYKSSCCI